MILGLNRQEKITPVWRSFHSAVAAERFVRSTLPEVVAGHERDFAGAEYIPVARLRSDQEFLRDRLEERGIKCYVDTSTKRHVSELMIDAGSDVLSRLSLPEGSVDLRKLALSVYKAMEAKR